MVREEKVGERECGGGGGGEEMAKKWRECLLVGNRYKRTGPSTPPPSWRLHFSPPPRDGASAAVDSKEFLTNPATTAVSARKLCAELWEIEQFRPPIMRRDLRKLGRVRRRDKVEEEASDTETLHDGPPHDHQREISSKLGPDHRQVQRNGHGVQPVSPASYSSSLEPPSYSLKTSTKVLKMLNRIWSLEEQHAVNMSLVKALKIELDRCREEIKELQMEKHADREGITELNESKFTRRRTEQEKPKRRSDGLHWKLGQELCQVKLCLAEALKELERERRASVLLENLCDEFAEAVKEYDVRRLAGKSPEVERENVERLIVHVAEAWLDERVQMKLQEDEEDSPGNTCIVDKLGLDIETFLRAKQIRGSTKEKKGHPLQFNRSNRFEQSRSESKSRSLGLNRSSSRRQRKGSEMKQRVSSSKLEKASNLQNLVGWYEYDYHIATSNARFPEKEIRRDNQPEILRELCSRKSEWVGEIHGMGSNQAPDCMVRNQSVSSEGEKIHPESCSGSSKEIEHCGSHDVDKSRTCPKQTRSVKDNSLQAKLMEARLESRRLRLRF